MNASAGFRCPNCGSSFEELAAACPGQAENGPSGARNCAGTYFAIPAELVDPASTDRWVGRKLNDKILLGPLLGKGGMGSVYHGWQLGLMKRSVAIKMLYTGSGVDKASRDRFVREAHANALLRHEHIVQVFDADEAAHWDPPMPFIVMEIVENAETLKDRIRTWRLQPPPLQDVATVFDELLDALSYAHKKKIVHRDIKPANVMIQRGTDGSECLKVLDFGLARSFGACDDEALASVSGSKDSVLGTIAYMAPEQAMGEPVDGRADVYAVGSILFELLVGVRPFARLGLNDLQMLVAKSQMDAVTPEGGMPPGGMERLGELGDVLVGMMHRKPADRWDAVTARKHLAGAFSKSNVDLPLSSITLTGDLQTIDASRPTLSLAGALADSAQRELVDNNAQTVALSTETSSTSAGPMHTLTPGVVGLPPAPASKPNRAMMFGIGVAVIAAAAGIFLSTAKQQATPPPVKAAEAAPVTPTEVPAPTAAPVVTAVATPPPPTPAPTTPAPAAAVAAVPKAAPVPPSTATPPDAAKTPEVASAPATKPAVVVAAPPPTERGGAPTPAKVQPVAAALHAEPAAPAAPSEKPPAEKAPAPVDKIAAPAAAAAAAAAASDALDAFKVDGAFIHQKHVSKDGQATYLTWQRTPNGAELSGDAAEAYCDKLSVGGFSNWRLPSANELRWTNTGSATDIHAFPGSAAGLFWTAGKSGPVIVGIRASAGDAETARVRCVQ